MKKIRLLILPSFAIFFLLSCQPKPVGGEIGDTNWVLSSMTIGRKVFEAPTATTALFGKNKLTGNAPCNSYFATYEADGVMVSISEIGSTKRMCDGMDFENNYLGLLGKASGYSVLKDKLEIYSMSGKLTFKPMPAAEVDKMKYENGVGRLAKMFPAIEGDLMPHLYPILKVDNPGNYPYKGQLVDTNFYQYFDSETSNVWNSTGGDVFAVGNVGDLFICRVPGRYVSSDIALFQIKNGEMARSETVAWAWCDEGWCNQQDAWLKDVNKDGLTDIVQHYTLTDDKGKIREERLTVLVQTHDGIFKENTEAKPDKTQFTMANI